MFLCEEVHSILDFFGMDGLYVMGDEVFPFFCFLLLFGCQYTSCIICCCFVLFLLFNSLFDA